MASELYQLRVSGAHTTEYWENVMYFQGDNLSAGDVIHNAKDLAESFQSEVLPAYLDLLPGTVQVLRLTAKRQDVAGGVDITIPFQLGDQPGAVAGGASGMQLCPIVRLIPPMGTKSAGRFFLPAIAESQIANNTPSSTWITNLGALMTITLAGFATTAITWTQAIYSRKLIQYHKAMSYDTSPVVGFQRRRQRPY